MSTRSRSRAFLLVVAGVALHGVSGHPAAATAADGKRPRGVAPAAVPTKGDRAARVALTEVGVPYAWGGDSPSGFDCSGLVRFAYLQVGISLPHSSYALYGVGRPVARSKLMPGDLLFFDGLGHVGIYIGRNRMVHAPQTGQSVGIVSLSGGYGASFVAARRIAG